MDKKWIILAIGILLILILVYKKRDVILGWFGKNKKIEPSNEPLLYKNLERPKSNPDLYNEPAEPPEEYVVLEIASSPEKNKEMVLGELYIKLHDDICPRTCENFRSLSKIEFKGCPFHRLIKGFMIQGGDFTNQNGTGGESIWGPKFPDENFILKHNKRGVLAMANSGKDTNGSQFYITFAPSQHLDGKHVVFGEVVKGIEILDIMEKMPTDENDEPKQLLYIRNTRITNEL